MRRRDRSVRQRLFDILGAIEEGRSAAGDFSEASRYIPPELQAQTPLIPRRDVADVGNVIRHAYEKVDAEIIWTAVRKDFGSLEDAVRTILAGIPDDE
jgi:uncharacterized protein with HEPN domain